MARKASGKPTEGELEILRVLWERGPCTVREVNVELNRTKKTGYTTTLKLMQIMLDKGLLRRDESTRPQIYTPTASKATTQRQLTSDLLSKVFDGSAAQLVMQALAAKKASPKEMQQIRKLLSEHERGKQ